MLTTLLTTVALFSPPSRPIQHQSIMEACALAHSSESARHYVDESVKRINHNIVFKKFNMCARDVYLDIATEMTA